MPSTSIGAAATGDGHGMTGGAPDEDRERLEDRAEADGADQHQVEVAALQRAEHPFDDQPDQTGHDDGHHDRHGERQFAGHVEVEAA